MRILVVDDDYVSRTKLKAMLSAYGDVDAVPDGDLAVRMFLKAHEEEVPYGLISMDINMPGMRGMEVVKMMRHWEMKNNKTGADRVKILMVSATQDSDDMLSSFEEGCEGYLQKPVIPATLRISLQNLGLVSNK